MLIVFLGPPSFAWGGALFIGTAGGALALIFCVGALSGSVSFSPPMPSPKLSPSLT